MSQLVLGLVGCAIGIALMLADMWAQGLGIARAAIAGPQLLRNPDLMAVTTLALAPIQIDLGSSITPVKLWAPLALASAMFDSARTGNWRLPPPALLAGFGGFCLWGLVSETNAMTIAPEALLLAMGATLLQVYLLWRAAATPQGLKRVAMAYSVLIIAVAISVPIMGPVTNGEELGTRYAGLCGEPNWTGETAARVLPLTAALVLDRLSGTKLRLLGVVASASALYVQFASASRGGTLAMLLGMAAFVLAMADSLRSALRGLGAVVVVIAVLLLLAPTSYSYRVLGSFGFGEYSTVEYGDITSGRVALNSMGVEAFFESPWLGLGTSGWQQRNMSLTGMATAIHNGPLSALVSFGLPALVAYVACVVSALLAGFRALRKAGPYRIYVAAFMAHFASVMVSSQTLSDLIRNVVWVAPGLALAAAHVVDLYSSGAIAAEAHQAAEPSRPRLPLTLPTPYL